MIDETTHPEAEDRARAHCEARLAALRKKPASVAKAAPSKSAAKISTAASKKA